MFQIKKDGSVTTTGNRFKAALAVLRGAEVKSAETEVKGPLQAVPLPTSSASRSILSGTQGLKVAAEMTSLQGTQVQEAQAQEAQVQIAEAAETPVTAPMATPEKQTRVKEQAPQVATQNVPAPVSQAPEIQAARTAEVHLENAPEDAPEDAPEEAHPVHASSDTQLASPPQPKLRSLHNPWPEDAEAGFNDADDRKQFASIQGFLYNAIDLGAQDLSAD